VTSPAVGVGSVALSQLARDLHRFGPAGRRNVRERFDAAGQPLLSDAKSRASWSTRIPGAITVRAFTNQGRGSLGLQLRADVGVAPHARAYEGLTRGGSAAQFRHPVYGHLDRWVPEPTRPYLSPAVEAAGERLPDELLAAFEDAARELGFR